VPSETNFSNHQQVINQIKSFFEQRSFGVCAWWGEKLGINSGHIRLFFIYASFLTLGSPLVIYMAMAFVLEHKEYFRFRRRNSVWDL
jgi:phage shock protein PspC (stress-responsive transcriptional regulator)